MTFNKNILLRALLLLGMVLFTIQLSAQQVVREHTVEQGETLYRIGVKYTVTVDELLRLNPSAKDGLKIGQKIKVPSNSAKPFQQSGPIYHQVGPKETLYSIARRYGVSVEAILAANSVIDSPDKVSEGIIIVIPNAKSDNTVVREQGTTPSTKSSQSVVGLKAYTVPAGATLYSILQASGWSEDEFYHYNPQARDGLKADATILIPDASLSNNEAIGRSIMTGAGQVIVLALPFSNDKGLRFTKYYQGFLMALLEAKERGNSFYVYSIDSQDAKLNEALTQLNQLPRIDMIMGGVSDSSIEKLSALARAKGATYVIPFTSKDYTGLASSGLDIFQVNTPHQALYQEAARKFVKEFKGAYVQFVRFSGDSANKNGFISTLKSELDRANIQYSEIENTNFEDINKIQTLSVSNTKTVVIPDASSVNAANSVLHTLAMASDSLGISNVTAFGYPEWQTYTNTIGKNLRKVEGSFYTTFFSDPLSTSYKQFEDEFKKWYGINLGPTFPRYSMLGYDSGRYFFGLIANGSMPSIWRGVQSKFEFEKRTKNGHLRINLGVFFVQFHQAGEATRY